ncbi:hypothetical protein [Sinomonas susongensis]|uniref:hypothetical protein n=1 Tax=Sinomonas susongensis TaxID=1324851 RepID=UPI001108FFE0|nr:hypothetical protein [Sinomonas susongensis]
MTQGQENAARSDLDNAPLLGQFNDAASEPKAATNDEFERHRLCSESVHKSDSPLLGSDQLIHA